MVINFWNLKENYSSADKAKQSVVDGDTYGALYVKLNFSSALNERLIKNLTAEDSIIEQTTINFDGDLSGIFIQKSLQLKT